MSIPLTEHTILILPFTAPLLLDPRPLIPLIRSTLTSSATKAFTIIFTTVPEADSASSSSNTDTAESSQLYGTLRSSPQAYFATFQSFLGRIYATLAAAQWLADRVLLDVEVHFDGEEGEWGRKLSRGGGGGSGRQCVLVEGALDSLSPSILSALPQERYTIPSPSLSSTSNTDERLPLHPPRAGPQVVAVGGTFDHLHAAHKLLLHLALFLATRKLIVGVMADSLLLKKSDAGLVEPLQTRLEGVNAFLERLGGTIPPLLGGSDESRPAEADQGAAEESEAREGQGKRVEIAAAEITDSLGPTAYEADIHCLVVSAETVSGGLYVNKVRKEKGLQELELCVVDVIADKEEVDLVGEKDEGRLKELKMGSTGIRRWIAKRKHGVGS